MEDEINLCSCVKHRHTESIGPLPYAAYASVFFEIQTGPRLAGFGTSWWKHRCSWVCFPIFGLATDYPWLIIVSFGKVGIMNEMPRAGRFPPQLAASLFCSRKPVPLVLDPFGIARRDKIPKQRHVVHLYIFLVALANLDLNSAREMKLTCISYDLVWRCCFCAIPTFLCH